MKSARGGWIRDNLTSKLELESGRHYHVRFERGLTGQLIVKFVPTKLVPDGNRSASKLAAMLHKLEKEIPPETELRLEDVTVTPKDDCFEFSCKFDRSLHPDTITAQVLLTAIINGSLETYAGVANIPDDMPSMPKEFSTVRATITYSWCDSSSDTVQLRSDFEKALTTICRNINLLTKKGYTAREIAKFGFLGEAAIKPEELPTGRQGLPRLIGKMHGQEFDDNKLEGFWVHFENIDPGSALAKEIARLATKLLCQLFREQRTVEINDDDGYALVYGENCHPLCGNRQV